MRTLSTQFPIAFAINLFCPWIAVSGLALRSGSCTGVSHAVSNSRVINRSYQILRLQPTQFTARYGSTTDDYFFVPLVELVQTVVDRPAVPKFGGSSGSQLEQLSLRNSYLGLRHGQSEANLSGVISSDPNVGTRMHGLTALGRTQAEQAATDLLQFLFKDNSEGRKQLLFVTSDFLRAKETATICMRTLQLLLLEKSRDCVEIIGDNDQPIVRTALRERSFGSYDGKDLLFYNHVWPIDAIDADNSRGGVESVNSVIMRTAALIRELETSYSEATIVLTSHADTLQILNTYLCRQPDVDPRNFCEYRFKNGEVRNMFTLPVASPLMYK